MPIMRPAALRAHRPSAGDREAGLDHGIKESLPTGAGSALGPFLLGLLEGVVDGDRETGMRLFGEAAHRLCHSSEKKCFCFILVPMPVRGGDQFFGFRDGQRRKQVGNTGFRERRSQT